MRLLHVEDNALDADLVRRALERAAAPLEIDLAPTLADARARLDAGAAYDAVLTDLNLPDGHGVDLIREIRARTLPLAVVALTGQGDENAVLAALKAGADDYLAKNDDLPQRLGATLRAALQRFRADAARHARALRVLYAEHDAMDLDLTRQHFARHATNLTLQGVRDAAAALAALPLDAAATPTCDVLLLDYRLTGDNGLELLKTVREDRLLDLPVVMVTGQGGEDVAAHAMRLGATDYVVKRDNYLVALPAVIENAFHRVNAAREHAALRELNATLEQRVASRTRELQEANEELEAFASSVSHDLRAPLRAVDALAALLEQDHADALGDEGRRKVRLLRQSTAGMEHLIRDLLDFARTSRQVPRRTSVPTAALVRHCIDEFRAEIASRGVQIQVDALPDCAADPGLLRQVFVNLLGNAVKYTRKQPHPRIEVSARDEDGRTVFCVRDNGAGFEMSHSTKLFKVFQRLHRDAEFEGTGVGLAIVERIVRRHGGRVWAEAAPGQGAAFFFALGPAEAPA
jgi:signal transduction histidine kinase